MEHRAVFIDRDGTIAKDVPYCSTPDDFQLLPTVPEAIKLFNNLGLKVVVITNHSGGDKGPIDGEISEGIRRNMGTELGKHQAYIDAIYYCPHHPEENCSCHKPNTALFHRAAHELDIDLDRSFMIGNGQLEIDAGKAVGCRTVRVTTGPKGDSAADNSSHFTAKSILEAAQWVVKRLTTTSVTIVIPALNERESIVQTIQSIPKDELEGAGYQVQILVVDNASSDDTGELARNSGANVLYEPRRGKGNAIKTALRTVDADFIFMIDADLTYPADSIPEMLKLLKDNDVVMGSRIKGQREDGAISWFNLLGNHILSLMATLLYWKKTSDVCTGLWGFTREAMKALKLRAVGFELEVELFGQFAQNGCSIAELPINYRKRATNPKLCSLRDGIKISWALITRRFSD